MSSWRGIKKCIKVSFKSNINIYMLLFVTWGIKDGWMLFKKPNRLIMLFVKTMFLIAIFGSFIK